MSSIFEERRFASADGLSLYYRDYPSPAEGLPVLCLPGVTRNCRDFEDVAAYLQDRHRVLTPDLRGRGRSDYDPDWRNYHPGQYVEDTWRLFDAAGIERCIIVGTSLGGLMAMLMSSDQPERLAGVVMNDVGPDVNPAGITRIMSYIGGLPRVSDWDEVRAQTEEIWSSSLPGLDDAAWMKFARQGYREDENGAIRPDADPKIGQAFLAGISGLTDPWAAFEGLDMPTLILRGDLSDILDEECVIEMQRRKPHIEAVTIPNRGHIPLLNEPESQAAIDAFLATL